MRKATTQKEEYAMIAKRNLLYITISYNTSIHEAWEIFGSINDGNNSKVKEQNNLNQNLHEEMNFYTEPQFYGNSSNF